MKSPVAPILSLILIFVFFLFLGSTTAAQSIPTLEFVGADDVSLSLEPEKADETNTKITGDLIVLLKNPSAYDRSIVVRFFPSDSKDPMELTGGKIPDILPNDSIGMYGSMPNLTPFSTKPISITFGIGADPTVKTLDGILVASVEEPERPGGHIGPATLAVNIRTPESPIEWSKIRLEPQPITMQATRWLPLNLPSQAFGAVGEPVWLLGGDASLVKTEVETAKPTTRLSSSRSTVAELKLTTLEDTPTETNVLEVQIEPSTVPEAGTYEGSIALNPADENPTALSVTLKVQDFIVWPFVALLAGTYVAWRLLRLGEEWRPKKLLAAELTRAGEKYRRENEENDTRLAPFPFTLDHIFPSDSKWSCPRDSGNRLRRFLGFLLPVVPKEWSCSQSDPPRSRFLCCAIGSAKTREDLDVATLGVNDLREMVNLWLPAMEGAKALHDSLARFRSCVPDADNCAIVKETTRLLTVTQAPADASQTRVLSEQFQRQTEAVERWVYSWNLWNSLKESYAELLERERALRGQPNQMADHDRAVLHNSDPNAIYHTMVVPATSLDDFTEQNIVGRFLESARVLRAIDQAYPAEGEELTESAISVSAAELELGKAIAAVAEMVQYQSPEAVVAEVRRHDWWEFWASFVLTALIFVLAVYKDGDFGTREQYLGLILGGASGALVVKWTLMPWYRSYTASKPTTASTT